MDKVDLHSTIDAQVWAKEFMRLHGISYPDEQNMVGWFANAIMAGFDEGKRRGLGEPIMDIRNSLEPGESVCPLCKGIGIDPMPGCEPPGKCERCKGTGIIVRLIRKE